MVVLYTDEQTRANLVGVEPTLDPRKPVFGSLTKTLGDLSRTAQRNVRCRSTEAHALAGLRYFPCGSLPSGPWNIAKPPRLPSGRAAAREGVLFQPGARLACWSAPRPTHPRFVGFTFRLKRKVANEVVSLLTEETNMTIKTIVIAAAFALSTTLIVAPAQAKHRHHHHHKQGMSMGASGPSGPSLDGGGTDKSRTGGQGVSRKPAGE